MQFKIWIICFLIMFLLCLLLHPHQNFHVSFSCHVYSIICIKCVINGLCNISLYQFFTKFNIAIRKKGAYIIFILSNSHARTKGAPPSYEYWFVFSTLYPVKTRKDLALLSYRLVNIPKNKA
jgi:hypothetical protein